MFKLLRQARKNESGFTLIELLIVIVILGVLSAIVVFAVGGITDRGKAAACKSDVKTVEVASEAYNAKTGGYAASMAVLVTEKLLREVPVTTSGYTIAYNATTGDVTSTPACTAVTG